MSEMISKITVNNVLEAGCGEGYVSQFLYEKGYIIDAFDVSKKVIEEAKNSFRFFGVLIFLLILFMKYLLKIINMI